MVKHLTFKPRDLRLRLSLAWSYLKFAVVDPGLAQQGRLGWLKAARKAAFGPFTVQDTFYNLYV